EIGRRISPIDPARSLLLLKPTMQVPHGGGRRLEAGSVDYRMLEEWIAADAPGPAGNAPTITEMDVFPAHRIGQVGLTQQLRVTAKYGDGKTRDITAWAKFDSTDEGVVRVSPQGVAQTVGRGVGAAMIRFEGRAIISQFVVPYADSVDLAGWSDQNFVDRLARKQFQEIGIAPSPLCDDATFVRRAYLAAIGTLPPIEQATAFIASTDPTKRTKLVDQLLGLTGDATQDVYVNEYSSYWALKWSDLVKSNSATIGEQGMWSLHNWLTDAFRQNKPWDRMVRELVTAKGSTFSNGPANYFRITSNPQDLTEATTQLFLGVP